MVKCDGNEIELYGMKFSEINGVLSKNQDKNDALTNFLEPIAKSKFEEFCKEDKHEEI